VLLLGKSQEAASSKQQDAAPLNWNTEQLDAKRKTQTQRVRVPKGAALDLGHKSRTPKVQAINGPCLANGPNSQQA
jgi:hypothetical protein